MSGKEIDYGHQMNPWAQPRHDDDQSAAREAEEEHNRLKSQYLRQVEYAARHL